MQFYKIEMTINTKDGEAVDTPREIVGRRFADRDLGNAISVICERFNEKILDKGYFFISNASYGECVFGLVLRDYLNVDDFIESFIKKGKLEVEDVEIRETTLHDFARMLSSGERNGYVHDEYDVLMEFELENLVRNGPRGMRLDFEERILRERSKDAVYLAAKNYFAKDTFIPELNRIYAGTPKKKAYGHPVDYMIESDDERTQEGITQLLIQALYDVGRIENRRYCELELYPEEHYSKKTVESLFKTCTGGTMVVSIYGNVNPDDDRADSSLYFLEEVCKIIRHHCCDVLTIIQLPRECTALRMKIFETIGDCTFVEIKEELAVDKTAITYLKERAHDRGIRTDKELMSRIEMGHGYLVPELNAIFDVWYSKKLKTSVYSQYRDIAEAKTEVKDSKPKGSAYEELESMIGLDSAKKMIRQALDSYKAQKLFREKGLSEDTFCNHMIFTGNPGTAKTSVARLFARILKDNDVISKGQIVEVGRADLVGKYVGWTAPTVKRKFKEALGGILFIDEAYSLVDDRTGLYGDEAINTIVQEMENHRDELIVIFAGYPDKMEGFLDKNPGLRSRIAHHIHFEDYNVDELCQIANHIASQKGMVIDEGAMERIKGIMEEVSTQSDFGNGRYVRNVIEKARMAQSSRLVHMDFDSISQEDVKTIRADDIEAPAKVKKTVNKIGFAV